MLRRQRERRAGRHGIEDDRGGDRVVERDLVQRLDLLFLRLQPVEHLLPLLVGEVQAGDLFRAGDGRGRDLRARAGLPTARRGAGCEPRPIGGEVGEELPAVVAGGAPWTRRS